MLLAVIINKNDTYPKIPNAKPSNIDGHITDHRPVVTPDNRDMRGSFASQQPKLECGYLILSTGTTWHDWVKIREMFCFSIILAERPLPKNNYFDF